MLSTFLLTMRGTPYIYYGDELGMSNPGFTKPEDYRDKQFFSEYTYEKSRGADTVAFLKRMKFSHRDNGRTPFQWDASANAGFTAGTPWIAVNKNYASVNAQAEEKDSASVLNHFRRLVKLRKKNPVLVYGSYTEIDKGNKAVYAYLREDTNQALLVLLNFSSSAANVRLPKAAVGAKVVLSNYEDSSPVGAEFSSFKLKSYQATVYRVLKQ